jgi:multiple sugar transport system substrate-binding protein
VRSPVYARRPGRHLAALVLLAVVATACATAGGGGGEGTEAGTEVTPKVAKEPKEPVTITFAVASPVGGSPQFKKFAEDFHKQHPNITVEFQLVPTERATEKLVTQVAGGNAPDTAYMDASAVEEFSSRNALVNLDSYVAGSKIVDVEDYVEGFRATAEYKGSLFGLPFDGETTGLFYRTDLFQQAGISGPPTDWQSLEQAAAALTDKPNRTYGWIMFAPEAYYYWYPFLWQAGGDLLSEDEQDVAFDDPAGQEAAAFYIGLSRYSPPDYFSSNSFDGRVAFATGKVAMYMAGSWFGGQMKSEFPEINGKWDVAPLPEGPSGCATSLAGNTLAILGQSENQDAAWLWLEYLSQPKILKAWTYGERTTTLLPVRQSLLEDPKLGRFNPWLEGFADSMKCAVSPTITQPKWPEIEQKLNQNLGKAIYGDLSPVTAVKEAGQEGEQLIEEASQ